MEGSLGLDQVVVLGLQVPNPLLHLLQASKLGKPFEGKRNVAANTSTSISLCRVRASMARQARRAKPLRARAARTGAGGVMVKLLQATEANTSRFDTGRRSSGVCWC